MIYNDAKKECSKSYEKKTHTDTDTYKYMSIVHKEPILYI